MSKAATRGDRPGARNGCSQEGSVSGPGLSGKGGWGATGSSAAHRWRGPAFAAGRMGLARRAARRTMKGMIAREECVMRPWLRPALAGLLGLLVCAAGLPGQPAGKPGPRAVSYAELGRLVRGLKGKVVVVYFW